MEIGIVATRFVVHNNHPQSLVIVDHKSQAIMQYLFTHTCTAGAVKGGCGVGVPDVEFTECDTRSKEYQFLLSDAQRRELYCKVPPSFPLSIFK